METPLPEAPPKPNPLVCFLLFLAVFGVYLRTLCPTFNVNDSAETILACHTLSLQHPPGYPLFTLWGRLVDLLPLGQPMFRVSLASALLGALSVVTLYGALVRWNVFTGALNRFFALSATLCFAFSFPFWFQAGGAKGGLYVLNAFVTIAVFHLLLDAKNRARPARTLCLVFFMVGLGLANHWPSQLVAIPAYVILALPLLEILAGEPAKWVQAAVFLFAGLSSYLFLPLRAHLKPILNWWDPQTADHFTRMIMRSSYDTMGATWSGEILVLNLVRLAKKLNLFDGFLFTWAVLFLALAGFFFLFQRSKGTFMFPGFLLLALVTPSSVVLTSKSVKGYEWMIDSFFTPLILALCVLAALAAAVLMERNPSLFQGRRALKGLLILPALFPLFLNFHAADQSRYVCSYQYGLNELKTVIPGSLIICSGDIDLMPFYYVKDVQGRRPDVAYFTAWIIQYDWYQQQVFGRWPDLKIPALIPDSKTIILDLVKYKANQRPMYFTNIFTPMWLLHPENTIPEGFLWRIKTSRGLNFADDTQNADRLWGTYRLGGLDSNQGYWDDPTTILKDSYGFALELSGSYYRHLKKLPLSAWFYQKAMDYRIPKARASLEKQLKEVTLP